MRNAFLDAPVWMPCGEFRKKASSCSYIELSMQNGSGVSLQEYMKK